VVAWIAYGVPVLALFVLPSLKVKRTPAPAPQK